MLKPYICVACEKVILEQPLPGGVQGGTASLITLFNRIIAAVPTIEDVSKIPTNAVYPKEWAIYSSWDHEPGDENRNYIICTQIYYPDQSPFGETSKSQLAIEPKKRSQNIVRILGFPVGQQGAYIIKTWIEENDQKIFGPIEFNIDVEIRNQDQPQKTQ